MDRPTLPPQPNRRNFLTKAAAIVISGLVTLIPSAAGLLVFFDPLRRKSIKGGFVRVASLSAIPENGVAQKVQVLKTKTDVWNVVPDEPVGAVYLQRVGPGKVRALNAKCPHAGCFVNFKAGADMHFHCPCHDSTFMMDGQKKNPNSPSPRPLDELEVQLQAPDGTVTPDGTEVYVKFQNYRVGMKHKEPV
ncbi:MAG: Rieske 2Fe-2S domain-containing protein [Opitutaceae bacterium]